MGEIAEAMLDGTLCASCGDFLGMDEGFPIYCSACAPDFPDMPSEHGMKAASRPARYSKEGKEAKPYSCQIDGCGKRFASEAAKRSHRRQKHGRAA